MYSRRSFRTDDSRSCKACPLSTKCAAQGAEAPHGQISTFSCGRATARVPRCVCHVSAMSPRHSEHDHRSYFKLHRAVPNAQQRPSTPLQSVTERAPPRRHGAPRTGPAVRARARGGARFRGATSERVLRVCCRRDMVSALAARCAPLSRSGLSPGLGGVSYRFWV